MTRMVFRCDGYYRTTAYTTYLPDGTVKDSWDSILGQTEAIRPDTIADEIERKLCVGEPFS